MAGAVALSLGLIQWIFNHDPCGSNYEYGWVALGAVFLLLPLGAVITARSEGLDADVARRQRTYAVGAVVLLALGVAAWQVTAIDVPGIQDYDVPFFGEGLACGL